MRRVLPFAVILCAAAALPAQLRRAVAEADYVTVARPVGAARALDAEHVVRRFAVESVLRGNPPQQFDLVTPTDGGDPGDRARLYCLQDAATAAPDGAVRRLAPVRSLRSPPIVDASADATTALAVARLLIASEVGANPARIASGLVREALYGAGPARVDALESLRERPALRGTMSPVAREGLMLRAVGETSDPAFAVALATLCAEAGQPGVVEALCIGLQSNDAPASALAVGQVAGRLHGENALGVLLPFWRQAKGPVRDRLLLAIGATSTDAALEFLEGERKRSGPRPAVDAAFAAHGAAALHDAVVTHTGSGPADADRRAR